MVERQLPKLDTRVRFPSPAFIGEKYAIQQLAKRASPQSRAKAELVRDDLRDLKIGQQPVKIHFDCGRAAV